MPSSLPTDAVERVATALANADLDGPDPDDYWAHLANSAILAMQAVRPSDGVVDDSPKTLAKIGTAIAAAVGDQGFELSPQQALYAALKVVQALAATNQESVSE